MLYTTEAAEKSDAVWMLRYALVTCKDTNSSGRREHIKISQKIQREDFG